MAAHTVLFSEEQIAQSKEEHPYLRISLYFYYYTRLRHADLTTLLKQKRCSCHASDKKYHQGVLDVFVLQENPIAFPQDVYLLVQRRKRSTSKHIGRSPGN